MGLELAMGALPRNSHISATFAVMNSRCTDLLRSTGECQSLFFHFPVFSFFFFASSFSKLFPFSQAAAAATIPSALFVERLSLGASWVYLIQ
jgi:hypothetical protein